MLNVNAMEKTPQERQLQTVLRIYTFVFAGAAIGYALLPFFSFTKDFGRHVLFVPNSVVKVGLLALLCMYAGGNVRNRSNLVPVFFLAHAVSISAMLVLLVFGNTSATIRMGSQDVTVRQALLFSIATDVVVNIPLLIFYIKVVRATKGKPCYPEHVRFTEKVTGLKIFLYALVLFYVAGAFVYEIGGLSNTYAAFFMQLPLISNSVVKMGLLTFIALYVLRDVGKNLPITGILTAGGFLSIAAKLIMLLTGKADEWVVLNGEHVSLEKILWLSLLVEDVVMVGMLMIFTLDVYTRMYKPKFLRPVEFRALIALSDVIVYGKDEKVPFLDIASNVDGYIHDIKAHRRWVYRVAMFAIQFLPMLQLRAPLSELDSEDRKTYLKKNYYTKRYASIVPQFLRNYLGAMIRIAQQLCYLGYYNDARCHASIGYTPLSKRNITLPPPRPHKLDVSLPKDIHTEMIETDVCIIGSGAAGSILAYELAKKGRTVTILEKGKYVEPKNFTENEIEMIGKLYADGVFQQTEDFKFTILQGNCVGGSTVVNNAVSFDPPDKIIAQWNTLEAGIDYQELLHCAQHIRSFLSIVPQNNKKVLNPSFHEMDKGMQAADPARERFDYDVVQANVDTEHCIGCGYCNIGCRFGMKLSMLDRTLPQAQADFPGKVKIIAECKAERITTVSGGSKKKAHTLEATLADERRIIIKAKTFILSAGTIASSYLLKSSRIGKNLPVGKKMCFNMGTPLYAEFNNDINATEGLQISHYIKPKQDLGFVYETWWNPPVSQAINMPGWFEDHFDNMLKYKRMMAVGILVGTEPTGKLVNALTGGPGVVFAPSRIDLEKMTKALLAMGEILFKAGARRVMLNTRSYHSFDSFDAFQKDVESIVMEAGEMTFGTGHPQGGNAISKNPARGVVDEHFMVHGFDNLYVCDASVFPTALTVNPQLTVMSLAHYAASRIN